MRDMNDEEKTGRMIRQAYGLVSIPSGVKDEIRGHLITEIECYSNNSRKPWARLSIMVPLVASIAGGLVAYGYRISMTFV